MPCRTATGTGSRSFHVNAGSYWEKVTIPQSKGYILLEGDGSSRTDISFDASAHAGIDQIMRQPKVGVADVPQRHLHRPRRQLRRRAGASPSRS
ncbi:unnamed protein product [Urochloa humidicola]